MRKLGIGGHKSQVDVERMLSDPSGRLDSLKASDQEPLRDPLVNAEAEDPLAKTAEPEPAALSRKERRELVTIAAEHVKKPTTDKRQRRKVCELLPKANRADFRNLRRDFLRAGLDLKTILKTWASSRTYRADRAIYAQAYQTYRKTNKINIPAPSLEELRAYPQETSPDIDRMLTPAEQVTYRLHLIRNLRRLAQAETDEAKAKVYPDKSTALIDEVKAMQARNEPKSAGNKP